MLLFHAYALFADVTLPRDVLTTKKAPPRQQLDDPICFFFTLYLLICTFLAILKYSGHPIELACVWIWFSLLLHTLLLMMCS